MTEEETEAVEVDTSELSLILSEVRNLQGQLKNISEKQEELEEEIKKLRKVQRGGSQPSSNIKVKREDGSPGCECVIEIMKKAKSGGKFDGVQVSEVGIILEDFGRERSRKPQLNLMRKIASKFKAYEFNAGDSNKPSELHYRGDDVN